MSPVYPSDRNCERGGVSSFFLFAERVDLCARICARVLRSSNLPNVVTVRRIISKRLLVREAICPRKLFLSNRRLRRSACVRYTAPPCGVWQRYSIYTEVKHLSMSTTFVSTLLSKIARCASERRCGVDYVRAMCYFSLSCRCCVVA